jgi:PadR family transcriptional regulator, regulatory protein PadR
VTTPQKDASITRKSNTDKHSQPTRLELRFLSVFLNNDSLALYGYALAERLGVSYGSVLPLLKRFEKLEVLTCTWEAIDPKTEGRPRRKFYTLTAAGKVQAQKLIEEEIAFLRGEARES